MNVFFVCGAPKSGTTWLQRVLDAHPEVCCSGEGHFIERFSNPLAQVVNAYNRSMKMETEQVYEGRPVYGLVEQGEFDDLVRAFMLRRMSARAEAQTRWVGDKTPLYTQQLDSLNRLFPEARIIHIVRDPRDVAVSRLGHSARIGIPHIWKTGSEQQTIAVEAAIKGWNEAVSSVNAFSEAHPGLVHELRYIDLLESPIGEITRLFGFLGVATDRVLMEQVAAATSFEAMSGRPRGQEDPMAFLRKGEPGDWKSKLAPETARTICEGCGELMRQKRFAA